MISNRMKEYEEIYKDKEVSAIDGNKQYFGILEKIKDGIVYLRPSVVFENLATKEPGKWQYNPVLNEEVPTTFPLTPNTGFQSYSKGYLEKLVKSYKNWNIEEKNLENNNKPTN